MRLLQAFQIFFAVLFNASTAEKVQAALSDGSAPTPQPETPQTPPAKKAPPPSRSEAITLLAALQREARLVDLVQESLDSYDDEQVGAAARGVLRDCRAVLDRLFSLQPVVEQEEGDSLELPAGFDAEKFRLVGEVSGQPPFSGELVHHGWRADKCELPKWSGEKDAALIVSPAEVEIG